MRYFRRTLALWSVTLLLCGCRSAEPVPEFRETPAELSHARADAPSTAAAARPAATSLTAVTPVMMMHCIDVGQANATLLEFPCGAILIDAGAQDRSATAALLDYLERFFARRPDLDRTLQAVIITHNHIDHTRALKEVVERFHVLRYIDNGQVEGLGTGAQAGGREINVIEIDDDDVPVGSRSMGLTNADVDPVSCEHCDPSIAVLAGRRDDNPGWPTDEMDNKNNHSLVIRVDFGEASFLFTGDMELPAIASLLDRYGATDLLDVDVWHVGHHGSHNATSEALLERLTPSIAVISMGKWTFGQGTRNRFSTWFYGHPRRSTVDALTVAVTRARSRRSSFMVADAPGRFRPYLVRKAIYATGWDGNVRVRATLREEFRVYRGQ